MSQIKILVADDDTFIRDMLSEILKANKYAVETAENGAEACEKYIRSPEIKLIVSDMEMPVMDGLGLIKKLRQEGWEVPIIVLTSSEDAVTAVKALNAGADDYLFKNENFQEMIPVAVKKVLENKKLQDQNKKYFDDLALTNSELKQEIIKRKKVEEELRETQQVLEQNNLTLHQISRLDSLTQIFNRRRFDEVLVSEWKRAARDKTPLGLIMLDIDFFKQYNDTYGHQAGDDCLVRVARVINEPIHRPGDIAARYGGEEFAMILPKTNLEGAYMLAEALRLRVESLAIPHKASEASPHVTVSIGVASTIPKPVATAAAAGTSSYTTLISAADKVLYQAKEEGRNRVIAASSV